MSLLKRIEGASTGTSGEAMVPAAPNAPQGQGPRTPGSNLGNAISSAGGGSNGATPPARTGSSLGAAAPTAARPARQGLDSIAALRRTPATEQDNFAELRSRVQQKLIQDIGPNADFSQAGEMRKRIQTLFESALETEGTQLTRADRARLFEQIVADILGYGPIQPLLDDDTITEIMVNGPKQVYIERSGKLIKTDVSFVNDEHLLRVIDRIISPLGKRCDESSPYVDARLPDGSRVNIIIPPLALVGPTITIRKFSRNPLTPDDLVGFGTLTQEMVTFLRASVEARLNIIVAGGTGSGKTTLLNVLSSFIPSDERIITIEDSAELQLRQEHVVTLESRASNIEGKGAVSIRDLVRNALRMRPERVIVGECRSGEALDMLQAMNTGHDGSMTTLHSNTPRDSLSRLETMCLMAGMDLPLRAIREQISKAIELIVQQSRMKDGTRKVTHISEVQGMEGDVIIMQDIFIYEQSGIDERGRIIGRLRPTGIRPKFIDKFEENGIYLPPSVFGLDRVF
ncbi:MAG: type secretion system protein [Chloroflexi bacterium]|nr:type secretion system protein [Chloroflexota bacterium]